MKKTALIISVTGLIIAALPGFSQMSRKKITDIGSLEITTQNRKLFDWSPLLGLSVMAVGAGIHLFASRSKRYRSTSK